MIKQQWEKVGAKLDALSVRERAMVFLAVVSILMWLASALLMDPLVAEQKQVSDKMQQQQTALADVQMKIMALMQAKQAVDSSPMHDRIATLDAMRQEQEDYVNGLRDRLVPPNEMASLLEKVVHQNGGLKLVGMKSLGATSLIEPKKATTDNAAPADKTQAPPEKEEGAPSVDQLQIYKHGFQVTVCGQYGDLLRYVTALEQLPVRLYWGEAKLGVETYPESVLTLTLYTLSLHKAWMEV